VKRFFSLLLLFLFCACAPNLNGEHWKVNPAPLPETPVTFSMVLNNDSVTPAPALLDAYREAVKPFVAPDSCRMDFSFRGELHEKFGIFPAFPRTTQVQAVLEAALFCEDKVIQEMEFTNTETLYLFWFGVFRSARVQEFTDEVHKRFMEQLRQTLSIQKPVEAGLVSDY
jgi:hypothetical protein